MRIINILKDGITHLENIYVLFDNNSSVFFLFIISTLVIFLVSKNKRIKQEIILPTLLIVIVAFNPLSIKIMSKFLPDLRLVRFYWLFPITIVFAYLFTEFTSRYKNKRQLYSFVLACVLICYFGQFVFTKTNFDLPENLYKVPDEVIEICNQIEADGNCGYVLPDVENVEYYRQYDANIRLVFGRDVDPSGDFYSAMADENYDLKKISSLEYRNMKYIIFRKQRVLKPEEVFEQFNVLTETENYYLVRIK